MTIEETIKEAIDGGWDNKNLRFDGKHWRQWDGTENEPIVFKDELYGKVFLDPLFWQALGKGMGWEENYHRIVRSPCNDMPGRYAWTGPQFIYEMHLFIDHLASGGEIEEFFAKL